ncbi:MAG: hypothetical protein ACJ0DI_12630 [bacterium]
MLTIYHAVGTRSLRVIWTCEELKIPYQVETIPFTARVPGRSGMEENESCWKSPGASG